MFNVFPPRSMPDLTISTAKTRSASATYSSCSQQIQLPTAETAENLSYLQSRLSLGCLQCCRIHCRQFMMSCTLSTAYLQCRYATSV